MVTHESKENFLCVVKFLRSRSHISKHERKLYDFCMASEPHVLGGDNCVHTELSRRLFVILWLDLRVHYTVTFQGISHYMVNVLMEKKMTDL